MLFDHVHKIAPSSLGFATDTLTGQEDGEFTDVLNQIVKAGYVAVQTRREAVAFIIYSGHRISFGRKMHGYICRILRHEGKWLRDETAGGRSCFIFTSHHSGRQWRR